MKLRVSENRQNGLNTISTTDPKTICKWDCFISQFTNTNLKNKLGMPYNRKKPLHSKLPPFTFPPPSSLEFSTFFFQMTNSAFFWIVVVSPPYGLSTSNRTGRIEAEMTGETNSVGARRRLFQKVAETFPSPHVPFLPKSHFTLLTEDHRLETMAKLCP